MLGIGLGLYNAVHGRREAPPPSFVLSADTIQEGAAAGTLVGNVSASNGGVVTGLALTDSDGNRFALDGSAIEAGAVATDYDTATLHQITVDGNIDGIARSTQLDIFVTNVLEVTLVPLTLDADELQEAAAAGTHVGNVVGKAAGSTLTVLDDAGDKLALDGIAVEAGAVPTDYDNEQTLDITIRETHPDATNSPLDTILTVNIIEIGGTYQLAFKLDDSRNLWLFA